VRKSFFYLIEKAFTEDKQGGVQNYFGGTFFSIWREKFVNFEINI
jgi:hypothetical protein